MLDAVLRSEGRPLKDDLRAAMEPYFQHDFSHVRVHTDREAAEAARDLGAAAFTVGDHIAFGESQYQPQTPGGRRLLTHELTHVLQQREGMVGAPVAEGISLSDPTDSSELEARTTANRGSADSSLHRRSSRVDPHRASPAHARLPVRGILVQRDLIGTFPTASGDFKADMKTLKGALTGTGPSGLDVKIKYQPAKKAPYTNKLGLIQIIKVTSDKGANLDIASLPATTGPKIRTQEDKATGVEGGFFTDVLHQNFTAAGTPIGIHKQGDELLPYYQGGVPVFGFRRSEDPADIKAAEITDTPGTANASINVDFGFETVAKGDDNQLVYGALKWGFGLRKGSVINENIAVSDAASATFAAAIEKHRDFYVHEPVTLYFDFDHDDLAAGETAKVTGVVPYLTRFPDVRVSLTGFADQRGTVAYNLALADRRANAVAGALLAAGVPATRIDIQPARGKTTEFTTDATTSQDREANRRGNRRVMMEFHHTASGAVPAPAPAPP